MSQRELLASIVDYAGLFPPASLTLPPVVENYRGYRAADLSWMLGRLVLPFRQLPALRQLVRPGEDWPLSLLAGADPASEAEQLKDWQGPLLASSLEIRVHDPEAVRELSACYPAQIEIFFEVDWTRPMGDLLAAIADSGRFAKLRTGSVEASGIAPLEAVAEFLIECNALRLPFKATAGLHHPLRGEQALSYDEDPPRAPLHGFLNLFVAAALLHEGQLDRAALMECLADGAAEDFRSSAEGIAWRDHLLDDSALSRGRRFARSFGSCSFTEPVDDLRTMGWLS